MSPLRKRLNLIAGFLISDGLGWMYYPLLTGEARMQKFCASLSAGTPLSEIQSVARQLDYTVTADTGNALIHDTSSFGRFVCQAQFNDGGLVSSTYVSND